MSAKIVQDRHWSPNHNVAVQVFRTYRGDILRFVREQFKVEPDVWQRNALVAFAKMDNISFRMSLEACAGPGKTAVLAWCILWFLITQGDRGSHPKAAAVSETWQNLQDNLWAELALWISISPLCNLLLKWTSKRVFSKDHPSTWFISAKSWNKAANTEARGRVLSGLHSKYVLFIFDESGAIPPSVLKAAEQALATSDKRFARIIQAGNPVTTEGMLYHASMDPSWHKIKITGDPDDPDRSPRISKEWAQKNIDRYGRHDPWVMAYILGKFPKSSINTLLSLEEVEKSMNAHLNPDQYEFSQKRLGVDVARFGLDSTIIFPRQGLRTFEFVEMRDADTLDIASRVGLARSRWGVNQIYVDGTGGWGVGVVDALRQSGASPFEINFGGNADDPRYLNKRAEIYFRMANWVKSGGLLYKDEILKKELISQTYTFNIKGKFQLEEKEQIRDRLGFSPDRADALALTFSQADVIADPADRTRKRNYKYDYDPLHRNR